MMHCGIRESAEKFTAAFNEATICMSPAYKPLRKLASQVSFSIDDWATFEFDSEFWDDVQEILEDHGFDIHVIPTG